MTATATAGSHSYGNRAGRASRVPSACASSAWMRRSAALEKPAPAPGGPGSDFRSALARAAGVTPSLIASASAARSRSSSRSSSASRTGRHRPSTAAQLSTASARRGGPGPAVMLLVQQDAQQLLVIEDAQQPVADVDPGPHCAEHEGASPTVAEDLALDALEPGTARACVQLAGERPGTGDRSSASEHPHGDCHDPDRFGHQGRVPAGQRKRPQGEAGCSDGSGEDRDQHLGTRPPRRHRVRREASATSCARRSGSASASRSAKWRSADSP